MRILFYEDEPFWTAGLPPALERLGHRVRLAQAGDGLARLAASLSAFGPQLILTVGWTQSHRVAQLREIRAYRAAAGDVLHVHWSTEDPCHTNVWTLPLLEVAGPDAVLTVDPGSVELLRATGYATAVLPFAAHVKSVPPIEAAGPAVVDVALVADLGAPLPAYRRQSIDVLLLPLVDGPWRVGVWGAGWEDAGAVLGRGLPEAWLRGRRPANLEAGVLRSAGCVLALQDHPGHPSAATFAALAVGAAVLAPPSPGILGFFRDGEQLLCSASGPETLRLVAACLADPLARAALGRAGRALIAGEHSYDRRAAELMRQVDAWRREKRAAGRLAPGGAWRREVVQPAAASHRGGGGLRIGFELPPWAASERLHSAHLECFADRVAAPGSVACGLAGAAPCDRVELSPRGRTVYPYDESWVAFDLAPVLDAVRGGWVEFDLDCLSGLRVDWGGPGWRPDEPLLAARALRFWPRLVLTASTVGGPACVGPDGGAVSGRPPGTGRAHGVGGVLRAGARSLGLHGRVAPAGDGEALHVGTEGVDLACAVEAGGARLLAREWVRRLNDWSREEGGVSQPQLFLASPPGGGPTVACVTKLVDNPQRGPRTLISEWIGGGLAHLLGVPHPRLHLVEVPAALLAALDLRYEGGARMVAGLGLATQYVRGSCLAWPAGLARLENPQALCGIVVLDLWMNNLDRRQLRLLPRPGRQDGARVFAVDQGSCIAGGRWTPARLGRVPPPILGADARELLERGGEPAVGLRPYLRRLRQVTRTDVAAAVHSIPPEWGLSTEDAGALVELLFGRIAPTCAVLVAAYPP